MTELSNLGIKMDIDEAVIDEGLYSRQLYVLGHEAMKKMAASNVLIVGLQGLGVEIAKNLALAGVKSVTIFDPEPVIVQDLGSQFFLRLEDIGKSRAEATLPRLAELNAYVPIRNLGGHPGQELNVDLISGFQVVVLCGVPWSKQVEINNWTHQNGVHFIAAETRGLFGSVFNDFGPRFACVDPTGEQPLTGMIVSVSKDDEGLVTCMDETRHGLEDGDFVTFTEVQGMTELNGCEPRKVCVKGPYTFTIGDTTTFGNYNTGGIFTQVKMPKLIDFKSLSESLQSPEFFVTDFAKFDRPATLHSGFQALSEFRSQHNRLPRPRNAEDAAHVVSLAKKLHDEVDEAVVTELSYQASGISHQFRLSLVVSLPRRPSRPARLNFIPWSSTCTLIHLNLALHTYRQKKIANQLDHATTARLRFLENNFKKGLQITDNYLWDPGLLVAKC